MVKLPGPTLAADCLVRLFLLRRATTHAFRKFIEALPYAPSLMIEGRRAATSEVWTLMENSVGWQEHSAVPWLLSGTAFDGFPLSIAGFRNNHDRALYLQAVAETCPWAVLPFGADYTGLMVCFVSANHGFHEELWRHEQRSTLSEYFVSAYTRSDLEQQRFKGVIFSRVADLRGSMIWDYSADPSALLLRADSMDSPLRVPAGADLVMTSVAKTFDHTVQLRWIRASTEDAFVRLVRDPLTRLVVGAHVTDEFLASTFEQFPEVNKDPLWFGLKAVADHSWTYIPATEQAQKEIYVNVDPTITKAFISSDRVTQVEHFSEDGFC